MIYYGEIICVNYHGASIVYESNNNNNNHMLLYSSTFFYVGSECIPLREHYLQCDHPHLHCLKSYFLQLVVSKCSIIYHWNVSDSLRKASNFFETVPTAIWGSPWPIFEPGIGSRCRNVDHLTTTPPLILCIFFFLHKILKSLTQFVNFWQIKNIKSPILKKRIFKISQNHFWLKIYFENNLYNI